MAKSSTLLTVLFVLVLAGCGLQGERIESGVPAQEPGQQVIPPDAAGNLTDAPAEIAYADAATSEVLNFRASELFSGSPINGLELQDAPMIMTFVSADCEFSAEEGRDLADAAIRYPETMFVIVHSGGEPGAYIAFVEASDLFGQNIMHIDDSGDELSGRFGVTEFPSAVLMSTTGELSLSVGALEHDGIDRAVSLIR